MSEEAFYVVRDTAGAIYGPANAGTLRQWIGEGRITKQMHIAVQGTNNFVEAGQMPELASAFPAGQPQAAQQTATTNPAQVTTAAQTTQVASQNTYEQNAYNPNPYNQSVYSQAGYNQTGYNQGYQQGYPAYAPKSSGMATAALICGVVSFIVCPCTIVAIILGHMARAQIRREPDRYEGDGMALAGLLIGYIWGSILATIMLAYIGLMILLATGTIR